MKVRAYTAADFATVQAWWGQAIPAEVYPLDSTFILEDEGKPMLVVAIYYTNCKLMALMEGFCGNPEMKGEKRREMGHHLLKHCEDLARAKGYTRLIGQSATPKLTKRWMEMGFQMQIENMSSLAKEL